MSSEYYNFVYCRGSGGHVHHPFGTMVDANGNETNSSEDELEEIRFY